MHDQPVTLKGDYSAVGDNLLLSSLTAATKGGALGFADAGTLKWELYRDPTGLHLWDNTRLADILVFNANGDISLPSIAKLLSAGDFRTAARIIAGADPGAGGAGDIVANRGGVSPGSGVIYFGSSAGTHYLYFNGTVMQLTDALDMGGHGIQGVTTLAMTGALTGATTGAFSGALSALSLALSGALTGATTGNFSGDVTHGARIIMSPATAKILLGSSGGGFRDSLDTIDILFVDSTGTVTLRNPVKIPPTAGGGIVGSNYGSTMVKVDEQTANPGASVTLAIPFWCREVEIEWAGYCDNASAQALMMQLAGDTGPNYDYQITVIVNVTTTNVPPTIAGTSGQVGRLTPTNAANRIEAGTIWISNPDNGMPNGNTRKNWRFMTGAFDADTAATAVLENGHGQWRTIGSGIGSVKLFPANLGNLVNFRAIAYGRP